MLSSRLSCLISLLSVAGFHNESAQLVKLSGGAIAIPQKIYDDVVKILRAAVTFGLKEMFEDIPAKLKKIELGLKVSDKFNELSMKDISEFVDLTAAEKAKANDRLGGDGKYIIIAGQLMGINKFVDKDYLVDNYRIHKTQYTSVVYCIDDKQYAVYSGELEVPLNPAEAFQHNQQNGILESDGWWVKRWYEEEFYNWRSLVNEFLTDVKSGLNNMEAIAAPDGSPEFRYNITDDKGMTISDETKINTPRRIIGKLFAWIPVDLDGYKYFKDGIKYPKELNLLVEFFDPEKGKPEAGKDDYRLGYFSQGSEDVIPTIKIGIPAYDINIINVHNKGSIISDVLAHRNDALKTLEHELVHFSQYIIKLNAGAKDKDKDFRTGKFPRNKDEKQYDADGGLVAKPKLMLGPNGKMEWHIYSPKHHNYFWFGDTKPTEKEIRDIKYKNVDAGGGRLEHGSRDIEQKARLINELHYFKDLIEYKNPELHRATFKKYVGYSGDASPSGGKNEVTINRKLQQDFFDRTEPSHWLTELKTNEPEKWKQVVLAMYQELSKDPDVNLG